MQDTFAPQFSRETYLNWMITNRGTPEQRERYRAALAWFDGEQECKQDRKQAPKNRKRIEKAQTRAQISLFGDAPQADKKPKPAKGKQPGEGCESVKIWSLAMLAAIRNNHGGAARLFFLAKSLDTEGSAKVTQDDLFAFLAQLKVGERKRRRWLRAALDLGLLRKHVYPEGKVIYRLTSWGRGFGILGCEKVGKPASVPARGLVSPGWRALVWAGYLASLEGRIISQEKKHELTGVDPRTQRNYQTAIAVKKIQNYSESDLIPEMAEAASETQNRHYFHNEKTNTVNQRLPDIVTVPMEVARSLPKGRSRKAQQEINSRTLGEGLSYPVAGDDGSVMRLFHETLKGAQKAVQAAEFGEAFWLKKTGNLANQWDVYSTEVQL